MKDISQGESPISCRTRKRLHEKNLVLCEKQREMLYLEDYERVSGKVHEKLLCIDMKAQSPGYRGKGQTSNVRKKRYAMNKCS